MNNVLVCVYIYWEEINTTPGIINKRKLQKQHDVTIWHNCPASRQVFLVSHDQWKCSDLVFKFSLADSSQDLNY